MKVEIYGKPGCPFCERATELCDRRGYAYAYYDIQNDTARYGEFIARTKGARSVPQIFVTDVLLGGFTEFNKAVSEGAVDQMLGGA